VVSVTDPYGHILGFLDRNNYSLIGKSVRGADREMLEASIFTTNVGDV
jgi:hypothetical protein